MDASSRVPPPQHLANYPLQKYTPDHTAGPSINKLKFKSSSCHHRSTSFLDYPAVQSFLCNHMQLLLQASIMESDTKAHMNEDKISSAATVQLQCSAVQEQRNNDHAALLHALYSNPANCPPQLTFSINMRAAFSAVCSTYAMHSKAARAQQYVILLRFRSKNLKIECCCSLVPPLPHSCCFCHGVLTNCSEPLIRH